MEIVEQKQIDNAVNFSNSLVNESITNFQELLEFLEEFTPIFEKEKKKVPYHFNLIDVLGANENAHSRILEKLLKHQEVINERFEILESFIKFIKEKYKYKKDFQKININNPRITQEEKRIDLWIRDKDYSIIIENKIHWAPDRKKQLSRYIEETSKSYKNKQIYVLYLPPTYKQPEEQSWDNYFDSYIRKNRFLVLSFREDILPWIKDCVLPNIRVKNKSLLSAIEQYVDHLEEKFNSKTIYNQMNMELQKFIRQKLELNGIPPKDTLVKVSEKMDEMTNALNQLNELKKKIELEIFEKIKVEHFSKWADCLKTDFPEHKIVGRTEHSNVVNIGVLLNYNDVDISLMIEYDIIGDWIFYGIGIKETVSTKKDNALDFGDVLSNVTFDSNSTWYAIIDTSFDEAYMRLKTLIEKLENK